MKFDTRIYNIMLQNLMENQPAIIHGALCNAYAGW